MICYLLSSLLLGAGLFVGATAPTLAVWVFMAGLVSTAFGVVFALLDIALAYRVLKFEVDIY